MALFLKTLCLQAIEKKKKKATCEKRLPWQPTSKMHLCPSKRAQVTHINFLQAQEKDVVGGVCAGVGH